MSVTRNTYHKPSSPTQNKHTHAHTDITSFAPCDCNSYQSYTCYNSLHGCDSSGEILNVKNGKDQHSYTCMCVCRCVSACDFPSPWTGNSPALFSLQRERRRVSRQRTHLSLPLSLSTRNFSDPLPFKSSY